MYGLSLSDAQTQKIRKAADKNVSVTIRLSTNNLSGSHELPLKHRLIQFVRQKLVWI
jgi:hypothetical protein